VKAADTSGKLSPTLGDPSSISPKVMNDRRVRADQYGQLVTFRVPGEAEAVYFLHNCTPQGMPEKTSQCYTNVPLETDLYVLLACGWYQRNAESASAKLEVLGTMGSITQVLQSAPGIDSQFPARRSS
jgi:hypothetical protein